MVVTPSLRIRSTCHHVAGMNATFFKMKMSINKPKIRTKICVRIATLATDQKCLKANGNNCSDVQGKR